MIIIIIAGGLGTRLWPLSSPKLPKHLLKLSGERTLLEETYRRAGAAADEIYVLTENSHYARVKELLPGLSEDHILSEPGRRGTGNCILFALDFLRRQGNAEEPLVFIHSDHIVRALKSFGENLKKAAALSAEKRKIVLTGVVPDYNATEFGYIETGEKEGEAYKVASFKEKPDAETAKIYLESKRYLWNTGYFAGSVSVFLDEIKKYAPAMEASYKKLSGIEDMQGSEYKERYLSLKTEAIDFSLMEKDKELLVLPAKFDWRDVGNFKDLWAILDKDGMGNTLQCPSKGETGGKIFAIDTKNSFVRNEENKPVALIGIENLIVINSPNGLLITSPEHAHKAGEIAKLGFGSWELGQWRDASG